MICQIHNTDSAGRCSKCRSVAARRSYAARHGRPVPADLDDPWQPGTPCSVCGLPVLTAQDKHPRTCAHRKCGDPHSDLWRPGDACTKCALPVVDRKDKHKRFKAHAACIEAQQAETKAKKRVSRSGYNRNRWAEAKTAKAKTAASKRMPDMFVGTNPPAEPKPAPVKTANGAQVQVIPSFFPSSLRETEAERDVRWTELRAFGWKG